MLFVIALAAGFWLLGAFMGVGARPRIILILGLWLVMVAVHLLLPDAHPLRLATGGHVGAWLILGAVVLIVAGYVLWLRRMKARAQVQEGEAAPDPGKFSGAELERYARHIVLREIGGPGQQALRRARVLAIGAGGLGSPALLYLAAAGVGRIGVIDADRVSNSNLQRQVLHRHADIDRPKVQSATAAMQAQNPHITVVPHQAELTAANASKVIGEYDIVLDGCDNFDTRYLANAECAAQGKPFISGALSQWEGQLSVFDPAQGAPCYCCIFPERPAEGLAPSCAEAGVLGPLPGVIGTMMAVETIKLITGAGAVLRGEMLIYDALYGETRKITLKRRAGCEVCGRLEIPAPGPERV